MVLSTVGLLGSSRGFAFSHWDARLLILTVRVEA